MHQIQFAYVNYAQSRNGVDRFHLKINKNNNTNMWYKGHPFNISYALTVQRLIEFGTHVGSGGVLQINTRCLEMATPFGCH